jgi:hypothetical protein
VRTLAFSVVVSLCAPSVLAQRPRPDREFRGLFGGNGSNPRRSQQLDVSASLFGGYDDNVLAEQGQYVDPRFQQSGGYRGVSVSLDYSKRTDQASVELSGGTAYRYYPSVEEMTGFNSWGSAGFTVKLGARTTLSGTESVSYSPFYSFGRWPGLTPAGPGQIISTNPDYPLLEQAAWSFYSSAGLEHRVTPRSSLYVDYNLSNTKYDAQALAYRSWSAGGRYTYRLNRAASLRLGYHFRRARSGPYYGNRPLDGHDIDAGIDYTKALSISRKTTLGFEFGPSIFRSFPAGGTANPDDLQYQTHYTANASAFLNRQIGRSWSARLSYLRGVDYIPGFADPFLSDTVTASIGGFFDQRSRFAASTGYNRGTVGFGTAGGAYDTYFADANFQFAVTEWLAAYADYGYYHYLFDYGAMLPPGLNRGQDRQSVHVGVNLWLPILR